MHILLIRRRLSMYSYETAHPQTGTPGKEKPKMPNPDHNPTKDKPPVREPKPQKKPMVLTSDVGHSSNETVVERWPEKWTQIPSDNRDGATIGSSHDDDRSSNNEDDGDIASTEEGLVIGPGWRPTWGPSFGFA